MHVECVLSSVICWCNSFELIPTSSKVFDYIQHILLRYPDILIGLVVKYGCSLISLSNSQEVAESVKEDFGSIDILVHSLANGPEVHIFIYHTTVYTFT